MAGREKFFGGVITIGELMNEEHADDRGDRESGQNTGLFAGGKSEPRQGPEHHREPRAPDEEFQNHHEEQLEANAFIHKKYRPWKMKWLVYQEREHSPVSKPFLVCSLTASGRKDCRPTNPTESGPRPMANVR